MQNDELDGAAPDEASRPAVVRIPRELQMQLVNSFLGPVLGTVIESLKVHMAGQSIAVLAGTIGRIYAPVLDEVKQMDFQSAPRGVRKFWEGLCAAAEHAREIQREEENPTIIQP